LFPQGEGRVLFEKGEEPPRLVKRTEHNSSGMGRRSLSHPKLRGRRKGFSPRREKRGN